MRKRKGYDPYADFRKLSKDEQREQILDITAFCIDGASIGLARRIEIYFDVTKDEQVQRQHDIIVRNNWGP